MGKRIIAILTRVGTLTGMHQGVPVQLWRDYESLPTKIALVSISVHFKCAIAFFLVGVMIWDLNQNKVFQRDRSVTTTTIRQVRNKKEGHPNFYYLVPSCCMSAVYRLGEWYADDIISRISSTSTYFVRKMSLRIRGTRNVSPGFVGFFMNWKLFWRLQQVTRNKQNGEKKSFKTTEWKL